jgi:macrolide transport system ATP-binding/permease protein
METLWQDVRFGARLLIKNPGFALVAVLTLALGIGANTTIFSWLNSVLINSIPGAQRQRDLIVAVSNSPTFRNSSLSYPDYLDYREQNTTLQGLAIHDFVSLTAGDDAGSELIYGEIASANFFDVLGIQAIHGRLFLPEEDKDFGGHPVLVISYPLWQRRFGGDPGVVGRTVRLNNSPYTIVGITPRGFQGGEIGLAFDAWVPFTMMQQLTGRGESYKNRSNHSFSSLGRLKRGVSIKKAQAEFDVIARQLAKQFPDTNEKWTVTLYPLWKAPYGTVEVLSTVLLVLMGTVGVVLLIACANVANLLLARATKRRREIAIRLSVGASRRRLLQQLLTESILLSLTGGIIGVAVSLWTSQLLMKLAPPSDLPIRIESGVDGLVILFAFALSLITGIVFGIAPALQSSRLDVIASLKQESGTMGWRWKKAWLRNSLVVSQVALSLILLAAAGLFIRSLDNARTMKLGFEPHNVLLASIDLLLSGYNSDRGRVFQQQLLDRAQAIPGVRSATLARRIPLGFKGQSSRGTIQVEGYEPAKGETVWSNVTNVGPNYFRVMETPLVRGRDIAYGDTKDSVPIAVINETLAKRYWPAADPIGKRFSWAGRWRTIVGIARDSKYRNLNEPPTPHFFLPLQQVNNSEFALLIRTEGNPASMSSAVISAIKQMDPTLAVFGVRTLEEHIGAAAFQQRMASMLLGAFGGLALILAAIGVFGVISYTVTQQTREFGIRMALGAQPQDLMWWVLRRGLTLAFAGIFIGLAAAWGTAHLLRSLLLGVSTSDPATFVGVTLLLAVVSCLAILIPAHRAAAVDPSTSLRYQ